MEISRNCVTTHFLMFIVGLGSVMVPVGVSFSLLMCYDELYRGSRFSDVDLSAILDVFGPNEFMSCPQAMSFFHRLCPAPFSPVSLLSPPCSGEGTKVHRGWRAPQGQGARKQQKRLLFSV